MQHTTAGRVRNRSRLKLTNLEFVGATHSLSEAGGRFGEDHITRMADMPLALDAVHDRTGAGRVQSQDSLGGGFPSVWLKDEGRAKVRAMDRQAAAATTVDRGLPVVGRPDPRVRR